MISLAILGPAALSRDGHPVALPVRKSLALMVLLACSTAPMTRARITALLWPGLDETLGRRNLRRELARLREAGLGEALHSEGDRLALTAAVSCDIRAFDAALHQQHPEAALALWRGPLAEGFVVGDAEPFDDWLSTERERLRGRWRQALSDAAAACEARADLADALALVRRLLDDDALQELHHRSAMRLLAALGQREAALAQYEACRRLLRDELGLVPMAETEALAAALRGARAAAPGPEPTAVKPATPPGPGGPDDAQAVRLPAELPLVGRDEEIARLEAAWQAGLAVVVEGEGGVGKTRLCTDLVASHGAHALVRCRASDGEVPYAAFARALRALMGPTGAVPELPQWVVDELARLIPEWGRAPPPIQSDEERGRFIEACVRAWQALSDDSFDTIVLDDWHLADAASTSLLATVIQRRHDGTQGGRGMREWLLARPELGTPARDALQRTLAATGALHLVLRPLPGEAVLQLVQRLSGSSHPVRFAARLSRATGGNAFFVDATLRHLVESRLLLADRSGDWLTPFDAATEDYRELPLPANVADAVVARMRRLTAASQRVLQAASIAAEPFEPRLLAPACALSELDTVWALEEAVAANLVQERDEGGFCMAHDLARQALADSLGPERRRLVHRRLALAAEQARAPAAVIAAHHEASGNAPRAVPFRLAAGDEAERLHALDEAIAQWTRGLADGPRASEALRLRERICGACSDRDDADLLREQAERLAELIQGGQLTPRECTEAALARALSLVSMGDNERALPELKALPVSRDPTLRGRHSWIRCVALKDSGHGNDALAAARDALLIPDLRDRDRIRLLDVVFVCEHDAGNIGEALAAAEAQLALSGRVGNRQGIARGRYRRGLQLLQLDRVAEAESELLQSIEECERIGLVRTQRAALYNLGCVYQAQGRPRQTLAAARRACALLPPLQPGSTYTMMTLAQAEAHQALGELGPAWQTSREAVEGAQVQPEAPVRMLVLAGVAECFVLVGEFERARVLLDSLPELVLLERANAASAMWVALAHAELASGRPDAAQHALDRLEAAGGLVEEQVRVRHSLVQAAMALQRGDGAAALAQLPADDTPGHNGELRARALALRVAAEARGGALSDGTLLAVQATLQVPPEHATAMLELHDALAAATRAHAAGAHPGWVAGRDAVVERLALSLHAHPVQQAAFRRSRS